MSTPLWTIEALAEATHGRIVGPVLTEIGGISIDSRTITAGEAFFAILGERVDGHDYVGAALSRGAACAVVAEERLASLPEDGRYVVVDDVLAALGRLATAARARTASRIVAVTGSVGKTGTKEMLRVALAPSGSVHASVASFNNHWGVPLSLARMPADTAFGVFEIGMNAPGEITPLTKLVRPHAAIITTVSAVHAANFSSEEAIADAKAEILVGIEPGGTAILNRDNRYFARLATAARDAGVHRILGFGELPGADIRLVHADLEAEGSSVQVEMLATPVAYRIGAAGKHLVMNSLAVLAAAAELGADVPAAAAALAGFGAPAGRGARHVLTVGTETALLIDEAYNANPTSMRAAFAVLRLAPVSGEGRRIAVLGDMLELGDAAADLHAGLAEDLAREGIDVVHCCGPLMRSLFEALPEGRRGVYADASSGLESAILSGVRPGDAIMVKGSNGSRMAPIVAGLKARFASAAGAAKRG
jgi:UDP-N-acetylmuramoyl-tripeptide--D-alanyl-D-alanine ligase